MGIPALSGQRIVEEDPRTPVGVVEEDPCVTELREQWKTRVPPPYSEEHPSNPSLLRFLRRLISSGRPGSARGGIECLHYSCSREVQWDQKSAEAEEEEEI